MTISRRHLLQVGALGLTGLGLPSLLRAAAEPTHKARVKSILFLHQWGGARCTWTRGT